MRRWSLLFLVALMAVLAAVLITPSGAMAAPSSSTISMISTTFKGKVVAKNTNTHYFVVSFTCSNSALSGGWTYEVSSTKSLTGTLGSAVVGGCALFPTTLPSGGVTWSTSSDGMIVGPFEINLQIPVPVPPVKNPVGTLTLFLTGIGSTKTFLSNTTNVTCSSSSSSRLCIQVDAKGLTSNLGVPDFLSEDSAFSSSYATLNLTLPTP